MTQAMLSAYVRIETGINDQIRTVENGVAATKVLSPGIYWLGDEGAGESGQWPTLGESLLEEFETQSTLELCLQHPAQDLLLAADRVATGYIWGKAPGAGDYQIQWTHAGTTVNPEWFGATKHQGDWQDWTGIGTTYEQLSNISSSLCYVGDADLVQDLDGELVLERKSQVDSGKAYRASFGSIARRLLRIRATSPGGPRSDEDSTYHTVRRLVRAMKIECACADRFVYIPDLSVTLGYPFDRDDQVLDFRYGVQVLVLDDIDEPISPVPTQTREAWWVEWGAELPCREYVS